jgi:hypothetical protein
MLREKGNVHREERIAGGERNVYLNMAVTPRGWPGYYPIFRVIFQIVEWDLSIMPP